MELARVEMGGVEHVVGAVTERGKKSVFGLQRRLTAEYAKEYKMTKSDTLKIMLAMHDDRVAEEKNKRAAQVTAASMPARKGK